MASTKCTFTSVGVLQNNEFWENWQGEHTFHSSHILLIKPQYPFWNDFQEIVPILMNASSINCCFFGQNYTKPGDKQQDWFPPSGFLQFLFCWLLNREAHPWYTVTKDGLPPSGKVTLTDVSLHLGGRLTEVWGRKRTPAGQTSQVNLMAIGWHLTDYFHNQPQGPSKSQFIS